MFKKYLSFNLLALIFFVVDRFFKLWFFNNPSVDLGGDFILSFKYAINYGVAFGLGSNQLVLSILIIIVIVVIVHYLIRAYLEKNSLAVFSLTLILAGSLSNLIDRLRYGFVIDYIDLKWFTVFNLADIMITVGVVILIFDLWFYQRLDKPKKIV